MKSMMAALNSFDPKRFQGSCRLQKNVNSLKTAIFSSYVVASTSVSSNCIVGPMKHRVSEWPLSPHILLALRAHQDSLHKDLAGSRLGLSALALVNYSSNQMKPVWVRHCVQRY